LLRKALIRAVKPSHTAGTLCAIFAKNIFSKYIEKNMTLQYNNLMKEFWDKRFMEERYIFGCEPGDIAILCEKTFKENNVKDILIIGIGYGRTGNF
jgi:hypothetical protein